MSKSVSFFFCAIKTTKRTSLRVTVTVLYDFGDCPEKWHNMAQSIKGRFNLQAYFSVSYSVFDIKSASGCTQTRSGGVAKHSFLTRPVSFQVQGSVLQCVHKNKQTKNLNTFQTSNMTAT